MGLLGKKRPVEWVRVASTADFAISLQVKYNGQEYALFKTSEGIFCTQSSCSHEYSPLCEGMVDGCEIYCEKHGSRFDLRTGQVINLPATENLQTYPVKLENSDIYILV